MTKALDSLTSLLHRLGLFALLSSLLRVRGTGAPKTSSVIGVVSVRRSGRTFHPFSRLKCCVPALLCAVVGLLAFTTAPALAAGPPETPETGKANPATITAGGTLGLDRTLARPALASSASAECPNEALRRGPSVALPDCRAYEQVSPVSKGGFDAVERGFGLVYSAQSSPNGEGVVYMGNAPFPGAVSSVLPDVRVSSRGAASWSTLDSTPPTPPPLTWAPIGYTTAAGYDFSEDLSTMAIKIQHDPLVPGMPSGTEGLYNLFLHHPDGAYSLVNTLAPTKFPPGGCEGCFEDEDLIAFAGASSDFSHVLFETNDILEGTGASANVNLYESSGGSVRLVGVLPDGTVAAEGAVPGAGGSFAGGTFYTSTVGGGNSWLRVNHAISADGSRVVFQAAADGGEPDSAQGGFQEVYDRIEGSRTVEVSAPTLGAEPSNCETRGGFCEPESAQFWAASADGSIVYFASKASLTKESFTGPEVSPAERKTKEEARKKLEEETGEPGESSVNPGNDLYSYDVNSGTLKDITVDTTDPNGAEVQGVVDASRDGSYVYFVAKGELVKGKGVYGQHNLYVAHVNPESHAVEVKFIATLEPGDSRDWTSTPIKLEAYVSPDGTHLAFMSVGKLTGYENTDQSTGEPYSEVYEYSTGSGALTCASCDPSGQRPTGNSFLGATFRFLASTPFHQSRVMSDDGSRVFFSSPDELTQGAIGPHVKIYEHEQNGTGSCVQEGGCVFLIAGGESSVDDIFLDASSDGSNVFFSTLSQLALTDTDNLLDVYDARVGGGFSEPVAPAQCAKAECQVPGGSPASPPLASGFSGVSGNLVPPAARPVISKAQKLAKAIRACPKRPKKRRAKCIALAKKRYGAKLRGSRAATRAGVSHRGGHS
jgi:hypothetical protein